MNEGFLHIETEELRRRIAENMKQIERLRQLNEIYILLLEKRGETNT